MIRLFASDMDGTLLNDKGYISDRTINAVKNCRNMEFILL
jgi:Cof-subfamily: Cof-like hydrolase|nr:HAD hydrolase family protein [Anaerostipes hadrus]